MTDAKLALLSSDSKAAMFERPLVDATWDNPHFWLRYALIRAALGLARSSETAVLGPWRVAECARTLDRLGVLHRRSLLEADTAQARRFAATLLSKVRRPEDILRWDLPHGFPAVIAYDALLKRQRSAVIDLADPRLPELLAYGLRTLDAAERIVEETRPDVVLVSHAVGFQYAGLAWAALRRGVPVLLATGDFGLPRFGWLADAGAIFDTVDRPSAQDIATLSPDRSALLERVGAAYLERRLGGLTADVGGRYAFGRPRAHPSRADVVEVLGWDAKLPIVAVYAPNWFDYPHGVGMTRYRDFLEWLELTIGVARSATHVNWLFRAHPCDDWYGGIRLHDLMPAHVAPHVRLAPTEWNGAAVQEAADALVTCHGTAGLEYAAAGKPVLLADRGWYHDVGFATFAESRDEYLDTLARVRLWDHDRERTRLARIFTGWFFGRPSWQRGLPLVDDSEQDRIYRQLPDLLDRGREAIEIEIETIAGWVRSGSSHYHTFKMSTFDDIVDV